MRFVFRCCLLGWGLSTVVAGVVFVVDVWVLDGQGSLWFPAVVLAAAKTSLYFAVMAVTSRLVIWFVDKSGLLSTASYVDPRLVAKYPTLARAVDEAGATAALGIVAAILAKYGEWFEVDVYSTALTNSAVGLIAAAFLILTAGVGATLAQVFRGVDQ